MLLVNSLTLHVCKHEPFKATIVLQSESTFFLNETVLDSSRTAKNSILYRYRVTFPVTTSCIKDCSIPANYLNSLLSYVLCQPNFKLIQTKKCSTKYGWDFNEFMHCIWVITINAKCMLQRKPHHLFICMSRTMGQWWHMGSWPEPTIWWFPAKCSN